MKVLIFQGIEELFLSKLMIIGLNFFMLFEQKEFAFQNILLKIVNKAVILSEQLLNMDANLETHIAQGQQD